MKIYLDTDFHCHVSEDETTVMSAETDFFDDKCQEYIEGYRYVPEGQTWTRSDGVLFAGQMAAPWKDWRELDAAQREYERELVGEYEAALSEIEVALGVNV